MGELADGVGERVGGDLGGEARRREEVEGEREIRGGEEEESLDENVGDGFLLGEVRVELVAGGVSGVCCGGVKRENAEKVKIRLKGFVQVLRALLLTQVIGNVENLLIIVGYIPA